MNTLSIHRFVKNVDFMGFLQNSLFIFLYEDFFNKIDFKIMKFTKTEILNKKDACFLINFLFTNIQTIKVSDKQF
ncbi:hypothetical protein GCM10007392_18430 [Saccharospirillum salsuginis]|uniref:Uncharacterized protein n=1 Tax=Saccharospirillum salsuginis TaxID=418750 RepID=A0A918N9P7_9GAMM|nr:hypothetical protein GCM10007392_18430 [Saccharospirillum salsuginis]